MKKYSFEWIGTSKKYCIPKGLYECLRCKEKISSSDNIFSLSIVRCPQCGYRILKRVEPVNLEYVYSLYLNPYNKFVSQGLQQLIKNLKILMKPNFKVKFEKIGVSPPLIVEPDGSMYEITPKEASIRNLSYTSLLYAKAILMQNEATIWSGMICLGILPVMVKSVICSLYKKTRDELTSMREDPSDLGGYFIIRGTKRVINPSYMYNLYRLYFEDISQFLFTKLKKNNLQPHKILEKISLPEKLMYKVVRGVELLPFQLNRLTTTEEFLYEGTWIDVFSSWNFL